MQPYFMPYIGYWQLMKAVDTYVIFDDVNYIQRGWVNRNNILVGGQKHLFSISLKDASQNKHFNEIMIADDFQKFLKTIRFNYQKAPYFDSVMQLLEQIVSCSDKTLSVFLMNSFQEVLNYLEIQTKLILSSSVDKDNSLKGSDKILDICKRLGATTYYNAIGGQELYDKDKFQVEGIELYFVETPIVEYPQLGKEFIPYLSLIDVLMNNSIEDVNRILDNYRLI